MRAVISKGLARGTVQAPPSKSCAHRAMICAALAQGQSLIKNTGYCDDIKATASALTALGADIELCGQDMKITGCDPTARTGEIYANCNESGSTLRFMIPLFLLSDAKARLTGCKRLFERPLEIYRELCEQRGLFFKSEERLLTVKGPLKPDIFSVRGDVSSQFITGLLFALPLLNGDSTISLIPPVESRPYINITLEMLEKFGINAVMRGDTVKISGNQHYAPAALTVDGDHSGAAFPHAFNTVGGNVTVTGLSPNSTQGDKIYPVLFERLCNENDPIIDITHCPDLGPVLMAVAACKNGAVLTGTRRLKLKECSRGEAMAQELCKFGVKTEVSENSIRVYKSELYTPKLPLSCHNDHRIAMALSLPCSLTGGEIEGCEAVNKSYPDYWKVLQKLGIGVDIYDN